MRDIEERKEREERLRKRMEEKGREMEEERIKSKERGDTSGERKYALKLEKRMK